MQPFEIKVVPIRQDNDSPAMPCIRVGISFSELSKTAHGVDFLPDIKPATCLIDTGAAMNVVDLRMVAAQTPVAKTPVRGVAGISEHSIYELTVALDSRQGNRKFLLTTALGAPLENAQWQLVLGQPFLQNIYFEHRASLGIEKLILK